MIKNFFIITFRNVFRNKTFSFLNIFGLAIGIACAFIIFLWVENELTYNHYFENRNDIYIVKNKQTYDVKTFVFSATPGILAAGMKNEFPAIKSVSRSTWEQQVLFSIDDKSIYENGRYVDSSFFEIFRLQFIKGNASSAFQQLQSLALSEKMAKRFFNSTDVVGKTLKVNNKEEYLITAVFKDLPTNVSLKFDWLMPFQVFEKNNDWLKSWGSNGINTYVQTQPNADVNTINKRLYDIIQRNGSTTNPGKLFLYSMNRWRLYNVFDNGFEQEGMMKYVRLFSIIAWIVLIIACINFMNLATARSEKRAKEVGIRKVIGAVKRHLIVQFISESVLLAFTSMLLAVLIAALCLPAFNLLVDKNLSIGISQPLHILILIGIALVCGIIAGSYPAFFLSSFNPALVLKSSKIKGGAASWIRKILVVTQFSASIILIICTILLYQQIQYGKNRDLGFKKQNLITASLQGDNNTHFKAIKNELVNTGVVENAALGNSTVLAKGNNGGGWSWEGKDPQKDVLINTETVSPEYINTAGMTIKEGRDFYSNAKADSNNIIINETLAKIIGKKDIIGTQMFLSNGYKVTIIGVIKDFVMNDPFSSAQPMMYYTDESSGSVLTIRIKDNVNLSNALSSIETVVKKYNAGFPFDYQFADEEFDQLFKSEIFVGKLAGIFSLLAIIISCLGLFGLAAFMAERRTKEIGVRKVLGATVSNITGLLSKDFLKLVLLSFILAAPIAWWAMNKWLQGYTYRIQIQWWVFAFAALLAIVISLVTVSYQSIKAALSNPIKSLRTE